MRHYEIVAVVHPDQQSRIGTMVEIYKKIVSDDGGVVHRCEDWGRRMLSYPIQNQHHAQYILMNIECENNTLEKLRETFRFSDSVMRSLVVRCERAITAESPIFKATQASAKKAEADEAKAKAAHSSAAPAEATAPPEDQEKDQEKDKENKE